MVGASKPPAGIFGPGERFVLRRSRLPRYYLFCSYGNYERILPRFSRIGALACGIVFTTGLQLFAQQSAISTRNIARFDLGARVDDKIAEAALISNRPTIGYSLSAGRTDLVLSLSKIENINIVSFINNGAAGTVTISTSNSKLAVASSRWNQIAKQDLTAKITKMKLGPTEAKYVKFSFDVAKSGRIADLAVYPTASLVFAQTAIDGKDARDFKESKEVAEAPPEEGPPPFLPDPPLFVFVPFLSE